MPTVRLRGPFLGLNLSRDPRLLRADEAAEAFDLNLNEGNIEPRPGLELEHDLSGFGQICGVYTFYELGEHIRPGIPSETVAQPTVLVKNGSDFQKIISGVVTLINRGPGVSLDDRELASFATYLGRVYVVANSPPITTNFTQTFLAQLPRPAVAPTVSLATSFGARPIFGTYDYKYTFFSDEFQTESPSSDASAPIVSNGTAIQVGGMQDGTLIDSRISHKRIYRRKISVGETVWSFVGERAANDPDLTDLNEDADFGTIAPLSFTQEVPSFRFLSSQAGVLWMAGASDAGNRLYFTRPGKAWLVDDFVAVGGDSDSDPITGIHAFQGALVVFKLHSIWSVTGNDRASIFIRKIHSGVGCRSHFSIVERDNLIYFLGDRGFYAFDGVNEPVEISEPIRPFLDLRAKQYDQVVVGVDELQFGCIVWTFNPGGSIDTIGSTQAVYFYRNSRRLRRQSWSIWRIPKLRAAGRAELLAGFPKALYGYAEGRLGTLETFNSRDAGPGGGTSITSTWKTPLLSLGIEGRFKAWKFLEFYTQPHEFARCRVSLSVDGEAFGSFADQPGTDAVFRRRIGRSGGDIQFLFTLTRTGPDIYRLHEIDVDYELHGVI